MKFGLIIVGDEILSARRRDRHQAFFCQLLQQHGHVLYWVKILPDDEAVLVENLCLSMRNREKVFCCGGIGATPDDHTRSCAAQAAGVTLQRHPQAAELIEQRFGEEAYPHRIHMANLPQGSELIPNPVNQVPGFSICSHYFLPGFPDMAHPMGEWVLQHYYPEEESPEYERSLRVFGLSENELMPTMQLMVRGWPDLKLFSLPRMGEESFVELGLRGRNSLDQAFDRLQVELGKMQAVYVVEEKI